MPDKKKKIPPDAGRAVEEYGNSLYRLCSVMTGNREDAQDAVQDCFLRYITKAPDFSDYEHEKAWLIRVTANACKDVLKSLFRRCTVPLEEAADCVTEMSGEELRVLQAVRELPKDYREVIYLHYYEGYTAPEIAGILRKNPNTVYTHLRRAKDLLRERLGGVADEE